MPAMPLGARLQSWREFRRLDIGQVATQAGLPLEDVRAIESETVDPPVSALEQLARVLRIPPSWLYTDPHEIAWRHADDEDGAAEPDPTVPDPLLDRMLTVLPAHRELYDLMTALAQHGDPKLLRAAELSMRSLLKQARATAAPWQSRPSGHFEPPSD